MGVMLRTLSRSLCDPHGVESINEADRVNSTFHIMAEIIGVVSGSLTLAALFRTCVEAFDLIRTAQNQERDYKRLSIKLNIEKCRLYNWGRAMRLISGGTSSRQRPLDTFIFRDHVKDVLEEILQLFNDSQKLTERYGCKAISFTQDPYGYSLVARDTAPIQNLAAAFSNFTLGTASDLSQKTRWVIQDKKRFESLIVEVRDLVNGLQKITKSISSTDSQRRKMSRRIEQIKDVETLNIVVEACENAHPHISQAASTTADTLSQGNAALEDIEKLPIGTVTETMISEMESLTITELKHRNIQLQLLIQGHGSATIIDGPTPSDEEVEKSAPADRDARRAVRQDSDLSTATTVVPTKPSILRFLVRTKSDGNGSFCPSATTLQGGSPPEAFSLAKRPVGFTNKIYIWQCKKCSFNGPARAPPRAANGKANMCFDPRVRVSANGIKYRWAFLAKCHVFKRLAPSTEDHGEFGAFCCVFCFAERSKGKSPTEDCGSMPVFENVQSFTTHLHQHRIPQSWPNEETRKFTNLIVGRLADDSEAFDINLPPSDCMPS